MGYDVKLADTGPSPTAVVAATTTWAEFPSLWGKLPLAPGVTGADP